MEHAQTGAPTAADNALVLELRQVMSVDTEAELCHEFRKAFNKHYDIEFEAATIGTTSHVSDGHLRYNGFIAAV